MKILHLADLHIGKKLGGLSLLATDQPCWAAQLLELARRERPQAIVIAGDLYDRGSPSGEAVEFAGNLLAELTALPGGPAVIAVAGNHDSGPLVSYLGPVLRRQNLYMTGPAERELRPVTLTDEYGPVDFWPLPYLFPAEINRLLGDTDYRDYDTAYRAYLGAQPVDFSRRNVAVAHQNVLAFGKEAERGGSETMVGGIGGIDYTVFDGFEYAALGHIHAAQAMGRETVRYAGSPLCYHFNELRQPKKGPVLLELGPKGTEPEITICELAPLHPLREVRGTLAEIEAAEARCPGKNEYLRAVLRPEPSPDGLPAFTGDEADRLRALFAANGSRLLELFYEYDTGRLPERGESERAAERPMEERFAAFWTERRGDAPDERSLQLLHFIAEQQRHAPAGEPVTEEELDAIIDFAIKQEGEQL